MKTEFCGRLDASSSATGCHHATGLYRVLIVWISLILMVYFGTSEVCVADMSKWLFLKSSLNVGYNVLFSKNVHSLGTQHRWSVVRKTGSGVFK